MTGFGGRTAADTFGPNGGQPSPEWHAHLAERIEAIETPPPLWGDLPDPRADPNFEPSPESWHPYLAGALDAAEQFVRRYVVFPSPHEPVAVALWIAHTHAADAAEVSPYLHLTSPEKGSGKTRLLEVLELLVYRPWPAVSPSEAVIYRKVEADRPTLLLDEVDAIFGPRPSERTEGIRALLNAGNRRGATVPRMVGDGLKMRPKDFSTFCPKALAGIGPLPDTVADRSITIHLQRRAPSEAVDRFRRRLAAPAAGELREALVEALGTVTDALDQAWPDLPEALGDRAADSWEPLLAIADSAGGQWPTRARAAAVALSGSRAGNLDEVSLALRLLADLRTLFERKDTDRLLTAELIANLVADDEGPWGEVGRGGGPVTPHFLARRLQPYGVRPTLMRVGETVGRGYRQADLLPAWARYLSPLEDQLNRYTVTGQPAEHAETELTSQPGNGVTLEGQPPADGHAIPATEPIRPVFVVCSNYSAHQSRHRNTNNGWVCDACTDQGGPST